MRRLDVGIEKNGEMHSAGTIIGDLSEDACFQYSPDYLYGTNAAAISISLPLREEPFSADETRCFFEGLLPEGFTRRSVAQWMHVDEDDYLSILHGLGRECLGALSITEHGEVTEASYEKISTQKVRELATEGAAKSAEIVIESHLSLTGASGKAGLYYNAAEDEWYLPCGTAPSTHIVKQSHIRLDNIVTNERLALLTAAYCGIRIPHSFIINTGANEDHDLLFATERYDRIFVQGTKRISGLPRPLRLHQEDFAQAMGIFSNRKYEPADGHYMKGMFDVLRKHSSHPIEDQLSLWDIIVFNYLIGNTDAHIKNFSLLYDPGLSSMRLAPAYDIISTTVYEQSTKDLAFHIGGKYAISQIEPDDFRNAAKEIGIGERIAMRRFSDMSSNFRPALSRAAQELSDAGYRAAKEMENRILQNGGISFMQ